MTNCVPEYKFHVLDDTGWNFRHALYHEQDRRTLIKAYGMKFLITVSGNAGKFDITKTVVIIVTGLGLMGLTNIMCDIVLLKSSNRYRDEITKKKFEQVEMNRSSFKTMRRMTDVFGAGMQQQLDIENERSLNETEAVSVHTTGMDSRTESRKSKNEKSSPSHESTLPTPAAL